MTELVFQLFGGIGLFLMGMVLLTDGLKFYAGDSMRSALVAFTGTPVKAFASGAMVTTLVQSSSATTVTVIGFVSAGLLSFPQSLGIVFGASLGTTGTGWIIAVLGLKVSVGFYALPLVGAGAFLRLLARGRWRAMGTAMAGFGLIFIGIDTLQGAMRGLSGVFDLAALPPRGVLGHLAAMGIGIVMTVVMQSSSAAVATTLTALHTGAVNFDQAASLVIGAAVGTTVTGVIAAIGGSTPAKRTALAHVVFNSATGLIAVALLPLLLWVIRFGQEHLGLEGGAMSLAAFHTVFIALGAALFLPFVNRFARLVERILPERGPRLTRHLDSTVLRVPAVALEATRRSMRLAAAETCRLLRRRVGGKPPARSEEALEIKLADAFDRTRLFLRRIPSVTEEGPLTELRIRLMHAVDHLKQMQSRLASPPGADRALASPGLAEASTLAERLLAVAQTGLSESDSTGSRVEEIARLAGEMAELRKRERERILQGAMREAGEGSASTLERLDSLRWLDHLCHHTWRICHYLDAEGEGLDLEDEAAEIPED